MLWNGRCRRRSFFSERLWVLVSIVTALGTGCSILPVSSHTETEESLRKQVAIYWQALEVGDLKTLRELVDPDLREALSGTLERLAKPSEASRIVAWSVQRVDSDGVKALVETKLTTHIRHPFLGPADHVVESVVETTWVRKKGKWYVILEEPSLKKLLEKYGQSNGAVK